jgi:hypothetical protein
MHGLLVIRSRAPQHSSQSPVHLTKWLRNGSLCFRSIAAKKWKHRTPVPFQHSKKIPSLRAQYIWHISWLHIKSRFSHICIVTFYICAASHTNDLRPIWHRFQRNSAAFQVVSAEPSLTFTVLFSLITVSIMFKIGYYMFFFFFFWRIVDLLRLLDGKFYTESIFDILLFHKLHMIYTSWSCYGFQMVLLSGHWNSNTTVPACFGSVFKSDKYANRFSNLLPASLLFLILSLNNDIWVESVQFSYFLVLQG